MELLPIIFLPLFIGVIWFTEETKTGRKITDKLLEKFLKEMYLERIQNKKTIIKISLED